MEPERLQRTSQKQGSSLKVGLIIGVIWTIAQFGASEGLYRLGNASGSGVLYDLSDTIAWPAGLLYHKAEVELFSKELSKLESTPEERAKWDALIEKMKDPDDYDAYDAVWAIFDERELVPYVDTATEYSIYIGVCVVWGIMIGILASAFHFIRKGV